MGKKLEGDSGEQSQTLSAGSDNRLVNLIALFLIQGKPQVEQIAFLSRAGFRPKEIAELIGTTPNTVSVRLAEAKRSKREGQPKKS